MKNATNPINNQLSLNALLSAARTALQSKPKFSDFAINSAVLGMVLALCAMLVPVDAFAQFNVPFVDQIGCGVVKWMKGPLAVLIFIVVLVATLVVGMIAKMDWGRIITIAVIFGIVQGIVTLLLTTGSISIPSSCM